MTVKGTKAISTCTKFHFEFSIKHPGHYTFRVCVKQPAFKVFRKRNRKYHFPRYGSYFPHLANTHYRIYLLQDPILSNPPSAAATEDCGPFRQMQYSIVHSLRFVWNAYGLRPAQSPRILRTPPTILLYNTRGRVGAMAMTG